MITARELAAGPCGYCEERRRPAAWVVGMARTKWVGPCCETCDLEHAEQDGAVAEDLEALAESWAGVNAQERAEIEEAQERRAEARKENRHA